jgi:polyhydroxyalkanoate synthesis regulator phasin
MPAELGGSQISSLLETLPGIASVLRSPVADALIKAMRAAAGVGEFAPEDAEELVRYAVRRGLIGADEGDRVLAEVQDGLRAKKSKGVAKKTAKTPKKKKKPRR